MTTVFDYVAEMKALVAEAREFADTATADMPADLAYAVRLAVPYHRWRRMGLGDEGLDRQMRLDLIAAHEYAGHRGYDPEYVDDWAEKIAVDWVDVCQS